MKSKRTMGLALSLTCATTIAACGNLSLTVYPTNTAIRPGEPVHYSLELVNNGHSILEGVHGGFSALHIDVRDVPRKLVYRYYADYIITSEIMPTEYIHPHEMRKGSKLVFYNMIEPMARTLQEKEEGRFVFGHPEP